jgi:hypothetical protein
MASQIHCWLALLPMKDHITSHCVVADLYLRADPSFARHHLIHPDGIRLQVSL